MRRGLFDCNSLLAETLLFEQFPALGLCGNGDFFSRFWRRLGTALQSEFFSFFLQCAELAVAHAGGGLDGIGCADGCIGNALLYLTLRIFFGRFLALFGIAFPLRLGSHECFLHKLLAAMVGFYF